MKIIDPAVRPCMWCNGDARNCHPHCWGCGHWGLVFRDEAEHIYMLPFEHEPTLGEVLTTLAEWHAEVRAEEARSVLFDSMFN